MEEEYISVDEFTKRMHSSRTVMQCVLSRAEFDKYRKFKGKWMLTLYNDKTINLVKKIKKWR